MNMPYKQDFEQKDVYEWKETLLNEIFPRDRRAGEETKKM